METDCGAIGLRRKNSMTKKFSQIWTFRHGKTICPSVVFWGEGINYTFLDLETNLFCDKACIIIFCQNCRGEKKYGKGSSAQFFGQRVF